MACQPLPLYPGWASGGVREVALQHGREAVAHGGARGEGYYVSVQVKEGDEVGDDHIAKIGALMLDIGWTFGKPSTPAGSDRLGTADLADDPLAIDNLLDEAVNGRPNNLGITTELDVEIEPTLDGSSKDTEAGDTAETSHIVTPVSSEDEGFSDGDVDGTDEMPEPELRAAVASQSMRKGRGRRSQRGKPSRSILMVRMQQLRVCVSDLCDIRDATLSGTATKAVAFVRARSLFQPAESNVGRRMTSLAARLLREIVTHLGKKGVIYIGALG